MNFRVDDKVRVKPTNAVGFINKINGDSVVVRIPSNTVANQLVVNYDALMWDGTIWADLNNFEDATQNTIDFAKPVIITVNSDTVYKTPGINIGN